MKQEQRIREAMINGEKRTYKAGKTVSEYTPWLRNFANSD